MDEVYCLIYEPHGLDSINQNVLELSFESKSVPSAQEIGFHVCACMHMYTLYLWCRGQVLMTSVFLYFSSQSF